ncbi:MAG: HIT domain-containing protein [Myxococcota bacterium]
MERLWAPWRMAYLSDTQRGPGSACVFCSLGEPEGNDRERLVLLREPHAVVLMNKYPYNNGHLLVLPRAHAADFGALTREAFGALHDLLAFSIDALRAGLGPHGVNLGMNLGKSAGAGIPDHLHYHLVPRWDGDTNFMSVVGETKVISQHILETYDLLKPHFDARAAK